MKIVLVDGNEVLIDDEDHLYIINCYNLKIDTNGYVYTSPKFRKMGLHSAALHKMLINPEKTGRNINIDHIDGNKLNNQKSNLRLCSHAENMRNRKIQENGTSKYKGVYWNPKRKIWMAYIKFNSKMTNLGFFSDEVSAANCYNYHAKKNFVEFALLNDCVFMTKEEWMKNKLTKNKTSKYIGVSLVMASG